MKKVLALILALCILLPVSGLALEKGQVINADPSMYANIDLSEHYTVTMYLVGDSYTDEPLVLAKINEILESKYNTTLELKYLSWSDYTTMYSLVLAGGEKIDCIYTAPWCFMFTEAAKGSFYEMDEAFIEQYMPLIWQYQSHESFGETYINGAYVGIPCSMMKPQYKYVAIREDLREKYGIAPLTSFEDYVNYAITIAEKETPESGILAIASDLNNLEMWRTFYQSYNWMPFYNDDFVYVYEEGQIPEASDIKCAYETEAFRTFCHYAKQMADAGCWSRSALTNTITASESFANNVSASAFWNGSLFNYIARSEQTEGVVCAAYDLTPNNISTAEAYSNSVMSITAKCENPERTAMVMDLLSFDTELNNLICNGIEGSHWIQTDESHYIAGPDYDNYPIRQGCATWWAKNDNWNDFYSDERNAVIDAGIIPRMVANPTITFIFDESPVKANMAAIMSLKDEYFGKLTLGLVDDVDATVDEMIQKMYDAGLQKIYDEIARQYAEWIASR